MKKILLIASILLISSNVNAEMPKYISCHNPKGQRVEIVNDKKKWMNDQISGDVVYIFANEEFTDIDGNKYAVIPKTNGFTAIMGNNLVQMMITFFPKDNIAIMSRHSNFKDLIPNDKLHYSSNNFVMNCNFTYGE